MKTWLRPAFVLIAAIAQIAAPALVFPGGLDGGDGPLPPRPPSPLEPAGYAFAIWGLIYASAAAFAVYQLTPAGRREPAAAAIGWPAGALYVGSTVWLLAARDLVWATIPLIAAMLALAVTALIAAAARARPRFATVLLVVSPMGLYAGWLTIALAANIGTVGPRVGFEFFGLPEEAFALLALLACGAIAAGTLWLSRGALGYAAAVLWALAALAVANQALGNDRVTALTLGLAALVVGATVAGKLRQAKASSPASRPPSI